MQNKLQYIGFSAKKKKFTEYCPSLKAPSRYTEHHFLNKIDFSTFKSKRAPFL